MKRFIGALAVVAVMVPAARIAVAQSKTITGETKTVTATVEAIESASRTLTLKMPDGTYKMVVVPETVKRFPEIKVGDTITARYYENLVIRLKKPGEKSVDSTSTATTPAGAGAPAGTVARQRTITATITAIDRSVPSITFSGPNGWRYSSKVEDKKALDSVMVGDKVDITWTDALMVSFETPPKK
jgi:hypothetical protein